MDTHIIKHPSQTNHKQFTQQCANGPLALSPPLRLLVTISVYTCIKPIKTHAQTPIPNQTKQSFHYNINRQSAPKPLCLDGARLLLLLFI